MNLNRIISILYLLLFFTGEGELYAWTYPTSKPSNPFTSGTKVEAFSDLEYNSETNSYTMKFSAATENSDVEMKGFRCYFVAKESTTEPSEGGSGAFSNAKVIHSDGTSTDLRLIDSEATGDTNAVYDLLGRKRDAQTKGLVIKNGIKVLK